MSPHSVMLSVRATAFDLRVCSLDAPGNHTIRVYSTGSGQLISGAPLTVFVTPGYGCGVYIALNTTITIDGFYRCYGCAVVGARHRVHCLALLMCTCETARRLQSS